MQHLIPFDFGGRAVRVVKDEKGEPLFVGKDVCQVLGYVNHNDALNKHCRGVAKRYPIADNLGRSQDMRVLSEPDVLRLIVGCALPAAEAFERWVFEEVLPAIRRTGSYSAPIVQEGGAAQAFSLLPKAVEAAMALGLDKNAAALSADQAVFKLTGASPMKLLGVTHLVAEQQELFFTPSELGARRGMSGRKLNMLLAEAGLQAKENDVWSPLPPAAGLYRVLDTGKRHSGGSPVLQVKWSEKALAMIGKAA